jgi:ribonucleoside-diphosphate reductase alpha chain
MVIETKIARIKKRDGRIVDFDPQKITNAIFKALSAVKKPDLALAEDVSREVVDLLEKHFVEITPGVEEVQDVVEDVLIKRGQTEVAKAYIRYRQQRAELRAAKAFVKVPNDLKLGVNALRVLARRYLLKDDKGNVIETPKQLFRRVAKAIAAGDLIHDPKADVKKTEEEFYQMMANLEFIPNTPTLMNAGTEIGQLSACFVLKVGDSIKEIFDAVKFMAIIHQSGGGTGFSFSRLRPRGDIVMSTKGQASGPLSFMRVFDVATDVVKQGGRRRGANMGILRIDHPDILEFITAKTTEGFLRNFNISVTATDKFMEAVANKEDYELINPRTGQAVRKMNAAEVFDLIIRMNWQTGDPGMVFIDEVNRRNQTAHIGEIESTNPCGEQVLHPYESCNLSSINLTKVISNNQVDWVKLRQLVRTSVHFLDNVIDVNKFPLPQIKEITEANRRIGLGVMGFAETLIMLNIPYDSEEALEFAEKLMKFIADESHKMSAELGETRGSFPNFKGSSWDKQGYKTMRNATTTTIAPTGTISIIAQTSSGIEPLFAISFVRDVMEGTKLLETNGLFEKLARQRGFYSQELMMDIATTGSVKGNDKVPEDIQKLFVTALDIDPEWHVRIQAAFQKYTDNAVSKTINLRPEATPEDIRKAYLLAYKLKCKGITVFRYGSKREQVLYISPELVREAEREIEYATAESEYAGGCPFFYCPY